eukprot:m.281121 g.281121  ORF g.281121 m.281121 type:complete len:58 (-) comp16329_c0_seq2:32-205(-)
MAIQFAVQVDGVVIGSKIVSTVHDRGYVHDNDVFPNSADNLASSHIVFSSDSCMKEK